MEIPSTLLHPGAASFWIAALMIGCTCPDETAKTMLVAA
jgi:hypothetical protein